MKLWHIIQWGNEKEGGNGDDTQCVVAASDLLSAVKKAEECFNYFAPNYRNGFADMVVLLGENDSSIIDRNAHLVVRVWIASACNIAGYPSWHYNKETSSWMETGLMYGN